ncbi:MAG: ADP-ribosylglycohydrolase family protein [Ramlibacter sp.]
MTASGILLDWILPGLGLAFFAAGAWSNAGIVFGWPRWVREARAAGNHVSLVMFLPGVIGAVSMWNGPWEWMRMFAWAPLLLDVGCVPYFVLPLFLRRASEEIAGDSADAQLQREQAAAEFAARAARRKSLADMHFERLAGCLLGTAVGDALGLASEGLTPQRQARLFPQTERYHLLPFGRGMCSDDTEHAIMVAQSLVHTCGYTKAFGSADDFRADLAWRMRWWLLGLPAGIGMATLKGVLKLWLFVPARWQGAYSAGNAPAMRSALIGVFWAEEPQVLRLHVEASSRLTHADPKAAQAALAVATAAALSSRSAGVVDADAYALQITSLLGADGAELATLIDRVAESIRAGQSTQDFAVSLGLAKGVTGYALHTVPVALHAWLAHPGDFRAGVLAAIRCGGDTDTVAAITGAIAGAGCGRQALPPEWLSRLAEWPRNVAWMDGLARALSESSIDRIDHGQPATPLAKLLLRNVFFLAVVLVHGFRRLLPPY